MTATDEVVLVLNAGSSSVKFCAFTRSRGGLEQGFRADRLASRLDHPHVRADRADARHALEFRRERRGVFTSDVLLHLKRDHVTEDVIE